MTDAERETLGAVLGRTPSGLFVLTARGEGDQQTGMLASWVQQAAFDPPAVTVAIRKGRYLHDWLGARPQVVLNLLGESDRRFLVHFGKGFDPGEPAFEGLAVQSSPRGLTILADALGWLEGEVTGELDAGDHVLYLVELSAAGAGPDLAAERPYVHVRKNGFNY